MLFDRHELRESLKKIAAGIAADPAQQNDLVQEALIHIWQSKKQRSGQTPGWHLHNCRHHLQTFLRGGRTVNPPNHFRPRCRAEIHDNEREDALDCFLGDTPLLAVVNAREMGGLLSPWLSVLERRILTCLMCGLGIRETASRLGASQALVIARRRRITALATSLGIALAPHNVD